MEQEVHVLEIVRLEMTYEYEKKTEAGKGRTHNANEPRPLLLS